MCGSWSSAVRFSWPQGLRNVSCRSEPFQITASYTDDSDIPEGSSRHIATWKVGPPKPSKSGQVPKLKVRLTLSLHGLVTLDSVTQVEEEEYEEVIKRPAVAQVPPCFCADQNNPRLQNSTAVTERGWGVGVLLCSTHLLALHLPHLGSGPQSQSYNHCFSIYIIQAFFAQSVCGCMPW